MYIIPVERILKSRSENSEKLGKDLFNYDLSSGSRKNTFTGLKTPQNCLFFPPLFQTIMDKGLGTLFQFWAFSNSHRSNPSLHLTNNVGRDIRNFFRVLTLYRVGGGRTARKFRKRCTVLRWHREITEKYEYFNTAPRSSVQDCSNEFRAGAGREKQYGWITFPPKKKRIYCHSLEYCPPITMPF